MVEFLFYLVYYTIVENVLLPSMQALEEGLSISKLTFFVTFTPIFCPITLSAGKYADNKAFILGIQNA
jgi:hypothetical protein